MIDSELWQTKVICFETNRSAVETWEVYLFIWLLFMPAGFMRKFLVFKSEMFILMKVLDKVAVHYNSLILLLSPDKNFSPFQGIAKIKGEGLGTKFAKGVLTITAIKRLWQW